MNKLSLAIYIVFTAIVLLSIQSCEKDKVINPVVSAVETTFRGTIDLSNLENYANQLIPSYITKDNTGSNLITDKGATLGRVLFYDKNLSANNTISCASCHRQELAFSDNEVASIGVNGLTGRHSMRLVNARFGSEARFFWDERASTLEHQTTMPIQDHLEMGFSGLGGDPSIEDLIVKLGNLDYYKDLFKFVYGSEEITEAKIQEALAQFIRSIQSFDSKYDTGRALVNNDIQPFPNFTPQENQGKNLFLTPPQFNPQGIRTGGGLGCQGCHRAPEFDIDPNSRSNGIAGSINGGPDFTNTRSPSLRNITNPQGNPNGPMMHNGIIRNLEAAIAHYGNLIGPAQNNPNLDPRLRPNGRGQQLNLTPQEINAVSAFLKTLSGNDVYINKKWSDPFH